jgi:hypothetical protein
MVILVAAGAVLILGLAAAVILMFGRCGRGE